VPDAQLRRPARAAKRACAAILKTPLLSAQESAAGENWNCGETSGVLASRSSSADMSEWYRVKTADPGTAASPHTSVSSDTHHCPTTCTARSLLGGAACARQLRAARSGRLLQRQRCGLAFCNMLAKLWSRACALEVSCLSRLLAASAAHDVARLAARPYRSYSAYLRASRHPA